jgi:hypothetical protein
MRPRRRGSSGQGGGRKAPSVNKRNESSRLHRRPRLIIGVAAASGTALVIAGVGAYAAVSVGPTPAAKERMLVHPISGDPSAR